jgi:hypothetical protein
VCRPESFSRFQCLLGISLSDVFRVTEFNYGFQTLYYFCRFVILTLPEFRIQAYRVLFQSIAFSPSTFVKVAYNSPMPAKTFQLVIVIVFTCDFEISRFQEHGFGRKWVFHYIRSQRIVKRLNVLCNLNHFFTDSALLVGSLEGTLVTLIRF